MLKKRITYFVQQVCTCAIQACYLLHRQEALSLPARQQAPEHHKNNLMTALLLGLDLMDCNIALGINHKTNTFASVKPFQRHTCGFLQKLSGHLSTSGKDLASLQGQNTPCGSTPGFSGFCLHVWESKKVAGWGSDVGTKQVARNLPRYQSISEASVLCQVSCGPRLTPRKPGHHLLVQAFFQKKIKMNKNKKFNLQKLKKRRKEK